MNVKSEGECLITLLYRRDGKSPQEHTALSTLEICRVFQIQAFRAREKKVEISAKKANTELESTMAEILK
jgi:hypothetical protein